MSDLIIFKMIKEIIYGGDGIDEGLFLRSKKVIRENYEKSIDEKGNARVMFATSCGETSGILLHVASKIIPRADFKVVFVDHGLYNDGTYRNKRRLIELLDINIISVRPQISDNSIYSLREEIEDGDYSNIASLGDILKKKPLQNALKNFGAKVCFFGAMKYETKNRENLKEVIFDDYLGVEKVYPLLNWTKEMTDLYITNNGLPSYSHFDPTKINTKKECGLHINGSGI